MSKVIVVVSGGMDSVTLAYLAATTYSEVAVLSCDYGQRHKKELGFARLCASRLGAEFIPVDMTGLSGVLSGSALTSPDVAVPEGHYAAESMKATIVPNRNALLLSVAAAAAVSRNGSAVAIGVHAGDHAIYPDCRGEFIEAYQSMVRIAVDSIEFTIFAPFIKYRKEDIVATGIRLGVPFGDTWSCYNGRDLHCGKCGTCVERREAFQLAGIPDPTLYEA